MVRFDLIMIRSLVLRLLAGLVVLSHALAMAGVCDCTAAPLEEAGVTMSSCHEAQTGLRISSLAACCCGDERREAREETLAPSLSPNAASVPAPLALTAPFKAPSLLTRLAQARDRGGKTLPRPPLRV